MEKLLDVSKDLAKSIFFLQTILQESCKKSIQTACMLQVLARYFKVLENLVLRFSLGIT